ncbi:MAG TPA: hypothetical protein VF657_08330 [Actinoplanes sp.]|jgi:hypothetical protein
MSDVLPITDLGTPELGKDHYHSRTNTQVNALTTGLAALTATVTAIAAGAVTTINGGTP